MLTFLVALCFPFPALAAAETVGLALSRDAQGRVLGDSRGPASWVQMLERSDDLRQWTEAARTRDGFVRFPLGILGGEPSAFFRIHARPGSDADDWKNQLMLPADPLFSGGGVEGAAGLRWAKFILRLDAPGRVYFQDSTRYLFHHAFATARLPGFAGMSPEAFEAVSLQPAGQQLVLGAVLVPSDPATRELGVQLVGRVPFPRRDVITWLGWVRDALALPSGWTLYYFPAYEQGTWSADDAAALAAAGFPIGSPSRWVSGDEVYSPGWAFGRLRFIASGDIAGAFASGRLRSEDILLTDAVPAEIPMVAGTLTLTPATPNSHVAILAQSLGLPFAHVAGAEAAALLRRREGREILLVAERVGDRDTVRSLDVEGLLSPAQRQQLNAARQPAALAIAPVTSRGALHVPVADLTPADIRFVGGKAAHFGTLVRAIPDDVPAPALAFTFDLWNQFLDRVGPEGRTLRARIADRLGGHAYPPDPVRLASDLAAVRGWIRGETDFGPDAKEAILAALAPFPERVRLRFRSSTNVEDSEQFSGAGLHDSFSGCVLDDLDGDTAGPSHCEASEKDERGVFRALRRVYASFYNDNAFLARLRYGVDESRAGMAVLVHPSFPDENELANGVATLRVERGNTPDAFTYSGDLVTQSGAVSVSNPEGNARPEVVTVTRAAGAGPRFVVDRRSTLVPLGGNVLAWPDAYSRLFERLDRVAVAFAKDLPDRPRFVLDFEYKRVAPDRLVVKQVREVPTAPASTRPPPFTLADAGRLVVFQHHGKSLLANHRLKSVWQLQSLVFPEAGSASGFDFFADLQRHDGAALHHVIDRFGAFSNAVLTVTGKTAQYAWTWPVGPLRGRYQLTAEFATTLDRSRPVALANALNIELAATYDLPQVTIDDTGRRTTTTSEKTRLVPLDRIVDGQLQRKAVVRQGRVTVQIEYTLAFLKFGVPGVGIFDGKSFPLTRWRGTTITGLTAQPIRLAGEFSQTYDSTRHNFVETFLFEPALEPGLDPAIRDELRAANIRRIRVVHPSAFPESPGEIRIWDENDQLHPVP